MPAKNIVKQLVPDSYYHVYNRGVAKQLIFLDQSDKRYFLQILDRHLNLDNKNTDKAGVEYKKYKSINLLCYCLMGNHYHLLIHVDMVPGELTFLMRSIGTSYTMYFNLKYKRVGPLFQGSYKAVRITEEPYLLHISRYIHLNPREFETYKYSSLQDYLDPQKKRNKWIKPEKILELFEGNDYLAFVKEYIDESKTRDELKHQLANF